MRAFIRYCKIWCSQIMGDLSLSRDCPEFTLSGHTVGSGWTVGRGPWATAHFWRVDNFRTHCGRGPSLDVLGIFVSSMCPRIVQAADTMIYMHFWRVVVLGHFVDNLWISMNPENGQCLSSCSVTRRQMGKLWNPYLDSFLSTNFSVHFGQQKWWKEDKGWL